MRRSYLQYIIPAILILISLSCRQAKYVAEGDYLLKDHDAQFVIITGTDTTYESEVEFVTSSDLEDLAQPETNGGFKLWVYNRIDTARYRSKIEKKEEKFRKKNKKYAEKKKKIDKKRIAKARKKGKDTYKPKPLKVKETRYGWRNYVLTRWGEAPVLLDSVKVAKSSQQMQIYMIQRGYRDATVTDTIIYLKPKKQKATVQYFINAGQPYIIDSIRVDPGTYGTYIPSMYDRYRKKSDPVIHVGDPLDEDKLDDERDAFSKYLRDNAFFGFNKNYIEFYVDTTVGNHKAYVTLFILPRTEDNLEDPSLPPVELRHNTFKNSKVFFYLMNTDTNDFAGGWEAYKRRCDSLGYSYNVAKNDFPLLDTIHFVDTVITKTWFHGKDYKKKHPKAPTIGMHIDTSIIDKGYYIFNGEPWLDIDLIDKQNFMEVDFWTKEYYTERTYRTMYNLGVFESLSPEVEVDPANPHGRQTVVHWELKPVDRQSFVVEPRASNTNSSLGVNLSASYTNVNLWRGAQYLKVTFEGGLQSQPVIIGDVSGDNSQNRAWDLNTWSVGSVIHMRFPKLVPMSDAYQERLSKRLYPSTDVKMTLNFQSRAEFNRQKADIYYGWTFHPIREQTIELGLFGINYVHLKKDPGFQAKLLQTNDPFLINSYASHFTLYNQINFKYRHEDSDEFKNNLNPRAAIHHVDLKFINSGGITNLIYSLLGNGNFSDLQTTKNKEIFEAQFTQFLLTELGYVLLQPLDKRQRHKIAFRAIAGMGWAYRNSISLPYEYSFFAGGSNDIRAFAAKTMAPGGRKTYLDTNSTVTQIGDIKGEINLEWRHDLSSWIEGALFTDIGNIWMLRNDSSMAMDPGIFGFNTFINQTAIGAGYGIRLDFDYLIVRLDLAFPVHNPYMPQGERWVFTPRPTYISYFDQDAIGEPGYGQINTEAERDAYINPFPIRINFGIGYPF